MSCLVVQMDFLPVPDKLTYKHLLTNCDRTRYEYVIFNKLNCAIKQ